MKKSTFRDYLKEEVKKTSFRKGLKREKIKLHIGYKIFKARQKAGLSQQQLAQEIGTKQSNISRLELGNLNFTVEMLHKIAKALESELKIEFIPTKKKAA